jgi:hypothetical protein
MIFGLKTLLTFVVKLSKIGILQGLYWGGIVCHGLGSFLVNGSGNAGDLAGGLGVVD